MIDVEDIHCVLELARVDMWISVQQQTIRYAVHIYGVLQEWVSRRYGCN